MTNNIEHLFTNNDPHLMINSVLSNILLFTPQISKLNIITSWT